MIALMSVIANIGIEMALSTIYRIIIWPETQSTYLFSLEHIPVITVYFHNTRNSLTHF